QQDISGSASAPAASPLQVHAYTADNGGVLEAGPVLAALVLQRPASKLHVERFGFHGHMRIAEEVLDAAARGPAGPRSAAHDGGSKAGYTPTVVDTACRKAAGAIEQ